MITRRFIGFSLGLECLIAACSSDSTPTVYVDLAYQVRCLDCEPRSPDDPAHEIKVVDGEAGYKLDCAVRKVSGTRRVDFDVTYNDPAKSDSDHVFKISGASVDGDDPTLQCSAHIVEGDNTYDGSCSSDPPATSGGPCQASLSVKNGVIEGSLYCDNIENGANISSTRYIVAPGTESDPAKFSLYGCTGL
jgi:hypothetical protein